MSVLGTKMSVRQLQFLRLSVPMRWPLGICANLESDIAGLRERWASRVRRAYTCDLP